jgi:HSP20 family molecular chaperone IbpA
MAEEKKEDYEEKLKKLEARIKELEKEKEKKKEEEPSIVEGVVSQFIPGLSGIIKSLEKSSPEFRKRIAETDAKIKHRLETGWTSKPRVEYRVTMRELIPEKRAEKIEIKPKEVKAPALEREPIVDVFETEKYISVIAELPGVEEKEIALNLNDNGLEISAGKYKKNIKLPSEPKSITEKTYKHGILELKMEKK